MLLLHQGLGLDLEAEEGDEARAVLLVVHMVLAEGGDLLAIQGIGRSDAGGDDVALIQLELYIAGDRLLGGADKSA